MWRDATILRVEDDELVRNMTADVLQLLGYRPVVAANPAEALEACKNMKTPIDLVISDVVMPGMHGTEMRDRMLTLRPNLKMLFVSGYTSEVMLRSQELKPGIHF